MQLVALGVHFELHPLGFVLLNGRGNKLLHGVGVEILLQVLFAAGGQGEHHGQGQADGQGQGKNAFLCGVHVISSSQLFGTDFMDMYGIHRSRQGVGVCASL